MGYKRKLLWALGIIVLVKVIFAGLVLFREPLKDRGLFPFAFAEGEKGEKEQDVNIQLELMKTLELRKEELSQKEEEIRKKEEMLRIIEKGIRDKVDELDRLKIQVEKTIAKRDAMEEASLRHLAALYKNMDPKDAAMQMTGLEKEIAIQVFTRMKSRSSSKIVPFLPPKLAKALSEAVVKRRLIQEEKKKKR